MQSGILFQFFYGLLGSWTAYLISVLYVEYKTRKEREKVDFRNHVIQWFEVLDGLLGKHWRNVGLASGGNDNRVSFLPCRFVD
ncbi:hypothetical protein AQUCO_01600059v1 [Aquilegia coerulea]|uniref:Amino acid transporter transmembrane domain-containing protein n=1 Tax=Aquilegia coerulea TaxID=218851 RepID=A0A2G5DQQ7_AQUCA|nr:hypothetical protein AQUCO_01600059v1 [Aquilegia coerulea]